MGSGVSSKVAPEVADSSQVHDLAGSSKTGNDNCVRIAVKATWQAPAELTSLNGTPKAYAGVKHAGLSQSHIEGFADEHHVNPEAEVSAAVAHNGARKRFNVSSEVADSSQCDLAGSSKTGNDYCIRSPVKAKCQTLAWTLARTLAALTSWNGSPKADTGVKHAGLSQSHVEVCADKHRGNLGTAVSPAVARNDARKRGEASRRNGTRKAGADVPTVYPSGLIKDRSCEAGAGANHAGLIKAGVCC